MKKIILAFAAALSILPAPAAGQSCPTFTQGRVLTAGQWQACFNAKQNALGYVPVNKAGDVMQGPLTTIESTAGSAGFHITPGTAPSLPHDGEVWVTTAGMFVQVNGATVGPLASSGTSALTNAHIYVGNAANVATDVAVSGDVTMANTGAVTIANNAVTLAKLATQATNTVLGNATSGTAVPTALAVGSCSTAASALRWTTDTGFGCNTSITAAAVPVGGITGAGTGVLTALAINVGSAGAFVTFNGALGTPSSGVLTNATGLPVSTGIAGLGTGVATALAVNIGTAGSFVVNGGALGTPSSGVGTNITGVNAATLGGATFAAPGTIGGGTPAAITGTTITGNTSVSSPIYTATGAVTFGTGGSSTIGFPTAGGTQFQILNVASAVNNMTAIGAIANAAPTLSTTGSSSIIGLVITGKGVFNGSGDNAVTIKSNAGAQNIIRFFSAANAVNYLNLQSRETGVPVQFYATSDAGLSVGLATTGTMSFQTAMGSTPVTQFSFDNTGVIKIPNIANSSTTSSVCFNTGTGSLTYNGTVGTCTTSILAAKNLKAVLTQRDGHDLVMALRPWRYEMKPGRPTYLPGEQIGFVAEEVDKVDRRLVAYNADGTISGVRYEQYTAALTAAFQHNDGRIARLEAANDNLRAEVDDLRRRARR